MRAGDFTRCARNRSDPVQYQAPLHARTRVAVGFVGEVRTKQIGAIHRGGEQVGGCVKARLIIILSYVDAKLCPSTNTNIIVVIRVRLKAGPGRLISDACACVDAQRIVKRAAIWGHGKAQIIVAKETNQRARLEIVLQHKTCICRTIFPV
jgi:hypothetical protein